MAARLNPEWSKVFERPKAGQMPSQRWQWHDLTGKYEQALYPGHWMKPDAICPPPGMGVASDACCGAPR